MNSASSPIAIIGFGTMGAGIAQTCAQAGVGVVAIDENKETAQNNLERIGGELRKQVTKGQIKESESDDVLARINLTDDLAAAFDCDIIIEAIPEVLEAKLNLFNELGIQTRSDTLLATNTSALSVTEIACAATLPERVCGLHWFNPVPMMPLVEVVKAERTSQEITERASHFVRSVNKKPIVCRDTPGFIVNRILLPVLTDAANLWDQGLASAKDIDDACRMGLGWPMGPLALCDLVGIDVAVNACEALFSSTHDPKHGPAPALQRLARARKFGRKSGEGFYQYDT